MKRAHSTPKRTTERLSARSVKVAKDYAKEYDEIVRLAQQEPGTIAHEWNKEGDVFKECTLYNDDRAVLTTHTVLL